MTTQQGYYCIGIGVKCERCRHYSEHEAAYGNIFAQCELHGYWKAEGCGDFETDMGRLPSRATWMEENE